MNLEFEKKNDHTDISRRRVALAGLALAAGSMANARADTTSKTVIGIEAPDDVYVLKVSAKAGTVGFGDALYSLKSYRLLQVKNHLDLLAQQIALAERPFHDGRVDEEIKNLNDKAENLDAVNQILQQRVASAELAEKLGLRSTDIDHISKWENTKMSTSVGTSDGTSHVDSTTTTQSTTDQAPLISTSSTRQNGQYVGTDTNSTQLASQSKSNSKAIDGSDTKSTTKETSTTTGLISNPDYMNIEDLRMAAKKAQNDFLDAHLTAAQAGRKKQDALDKIALAKARLASQSSLLQELLARLEFKAGQAGIFQPLVSEGSFVKKGHIMGTLTL